MGRNALAIGAFACILVAANSAASTPQAKGGTTTATPDTVFKCTPAPVVSDSTAAVPEVAGFSGVAPRARVVTYKDSEGNVSVERVPIGTWSPAAATPEELAYFRIPPRPAVGASTYAAWADEWVNHFTGISLATPCEPVLSNSATLIVPNWSGSMSQEGGVTQAYGNVTWKTGSPCAAQPDSFTQWVGIGGYNGHPLLQNGFWADHESGRHYAFWEAINSSNDTATVPVGVNDYLGDSVNIATTWYGGFVDFGWHDLTNGQYQYVDEWQVLGYPVSDFYDGASGEMIDERGTVNGRYSTLRNFTSDYWQSATVTRNNGTPQPIRSVTHDGLDMISNGYTYAEAGAPAPTSSSFTDNWYSCGVVG